MNGGKRATLMSAALAGIWYGGTTRTDAVNCDEYCAFYYEEIKKICKLEGKRVKDKGWCGEVKTQNVCFGGGFSCS